MSGAVHPALRAGIFGRLGLPISEAALGAAELESVGGGAVLLEEQRRPRGLGVLVEGEVSRWAQGRLIDFVQAPALLDLEAVAARTEARFTVQTDGPATIAWLPSRVVPDDPWVRVLAARADRVEDARVDGVRSHDDFFGSPGARLAPGPYAFGPFTATVLVLEGPAGHVRGLLPPGLHPVPGLGDRYVVVVADLENVRCTGRGADGRRWSYRETTPLLPCIREGGGAGAYVPELYPDAYMPIVLGRETYGFPKRMARTTMWEGGADLIVDQRRLLRLRTPDVVEGEPGRAVQGIVDALAPWLPAGLVEACGRLSAVASRLPVPVFVRQQLLSRRRPGRLRTDALVRIPFRFEPIERAWSLPGLQLRLAPGPILAGRVVHASRVRTGFRFGSARVVKNYRRSVRARMLGR